MIKNNKLNLMPIISLALSVIGIALIAFRIQWVGLTAIVLGFVGGLVGKALEKKKNMDEMLVHWAFTLGFFLLIIGVLLLVGLIALDMILLKNIG